MRYRTPTTPLCLRNPFERCGLDRAGVGNPPLEQPVFDHRKRAAGAGRPVSFLDHRWHLGTVVTFQDAASAITFRRGIPATLWRNRERQALMAVDTATQLP